MFHPQILLHTNGDFRIIPVISNIIIVTIIITVVVIIFVVNVIISFNIATITALLLLFFV